MSKKSPHMNMMIRAVEKAARAIIRDFGEVEHLQASSKGPQDFVTKADKKSEKILFEELKAARPDFCFLMEESGYVEGADKSCQWIIDPLDGTNNFIHGLPHWTITIALQKNDEIISGVIYDPIKNELFWAEKGSGAYMGTRRLRVSGRKKTEDALVSIAMPAKDKGNHRQFAREALTVFREVGTVRNYGCASLDLAYVASGRIDGSWHHGLKPWDKAAGILLIKEAGGFISEIDGGQDTIYGKNILAANPDLHKKLSKLLITKGQTKKAS